MNYHIENLTGEEAQLVWQALMELPARSVYPLLRKVEHQFQEQEAAAAAQRAAEAPQTTKES